VTAEAAMMVAEAAPRGGAWRGACCLTDYRVQESVLSCCCGVCSDALAACDFCGTITLILGHMHEIAVANYLVTSVTLLGV